MVHHSKPIELYTINGDFFSFFFFLAVLSLPCYTGFSPVKESRGYSLVVMCGLLTLVASHLGGFSCYRTQALGYGLQEVWHLGPVGSVVVVP